MTMIVNIDDAESSLCQLVERALAGEEVILARNDLRLVQLVPVPQQAAARRTRRVPGRSRGKIWMAPDFDKMTEEELRDWEGR